MLFYPMLDLNIQNRAILPCNLQHKTKETKRGRKCTKFKPEFLNRRSHSGVTSKFMFSPKRESTQPWLNTTARRASLRNETLAQQFF